MGAKGPRRFAIQCVGVGHFGDTAHRHLGRQTELGLDTVVCRFVQGILPKRLRLPSRLTDGITGSISALQRGKELAMLLWRRLKFKIDRELHVFKDRKLIRRRQAEPLCTSRRTLLPPRLERRGFQQGGLR